MTYTTPTLVVTGDVVRETRNGASKVSVESIPLNTKPQSAGGVGFSL
jgi:hypothetical protein